jgi:hypothetical protein
MLIMNYIHGEKGKRAEVHKNLQQGSFEVRHYHGNKHVRSIPFEDSGKAHAAAKAFINEDAAVNSAGSGGVAGIGVGPQGEPGVKKNKRALLIKMLRRKSVKEEKVINRSLVERALKVSKK